nr:protein-L-isoaspartate(D-aspartate) O-methyltransferase [Synergistales bacterium]
RLGLPEEAPFDRIIVTAVAPSVPSALMEQCALDARLVIPLGFPDGTERLLTRIKKGERFRDEWGEYCRFVSLLEGTVE